MAAFCDHCIDLKELPGTPSGKNETVGGTPTYVSEGSGKGSIVLATDIFGTGITNPKIVADKMAKKTGFTVYVPEIFPGGPIDPNDFQLPSKASEGMPDEKRMGSNMDNFGKWMGKDNGPDKTYPRFKAVVDEAAKKGPVGAVGYCYGGKLVVLASKEGAVKGVAIYHPAMLEPPEAEEIKTPVLINAAELDPMFSGDLKDTWMKTLSDKKLLNSGSKTYPNTVHGFGCRPDLNDSKVKAGHEESVEATCKFFTEVLV